MAAQNSSVIINSRENITSSDVNRVQQLGSRELQDIVRDAGRSNPNLDSVGGILTPKQTTFGGRVINSARLLPRLIPAAGFTMDLKAGEVFFNDAAITGDDSTFQVVRWIDQNLTFAVPSGANHRIDLVVATPAMVSTDATARNILLDPVTRTVAPAVVNKTKNPQATITVVTGTPAAEPLAPAVPGGAIALLEVFVPQAAADSTLFGPVQRVFQRATHPTSAYHGILSGCKFFWTGVNETTTSSVISLDLTPDGHLSMVAIDGEVIPFFTGDSSGAGIDQMIIPDTGGNNPFGAAAPATNDKPYYIYAVGGKNAPQMKRDGSSVPQPICFVESLVTPRTDGRPSAVITTPRGTTIQGAAFVGVGFVVQNSTRRKGCFISGDMIYGLSGAVFAEFNEPTRTLTAGTDSHTLGSRPVTSTRALMRMFFSNSVTSETIFIRHGNTGVPAAQRFLADITAGPTAPLGDPFTIFKEVLLSAAPEFTTNNLAIPGNCALNLTPYAYNMGVPRLGF